MTPALPSSTAPLLLYDGVCALCNWSVRLVLRFERQIDSREKRERHERKYAD